MADPFPVSKTHRDPPKREQKAPEDTLCFPLEKNRVEQFNDLFRS